LLYFFAQVHPVEQVQGLQVQFGPHSHFADLAALAVAQEHPEVLVVFVVILNLLYKADCLVML
jgi:hypothetical protein